MEADLGISPWRVELAAGKIVPLDAPLMKKIDAAGTLKELIKLRAETLPGSQEEQLCWMLLLQKCSTVQQVDGEMHFLVPTSPILPLALDRRNRLLEQELAAADTIDAVLVVYQNAGRRTQIGNQALLKLASFFQKK